MTVEWVYDDPPKLGAYFVQIRFPDFDNKLRKACRTWDGTQWINISASERVECWLFGLEE